MGMKQSSPLSFETRPSSFIILWVLWRDSGSLERSRLKFLILPSAFVESEFHFTFRKRTYVKLYIINMVIVFRMHIYRIDIDWI